MDWQDTLLTWGLILVVGFPLLIVMLTEIIDRLDRQQNPIAPSLRRVRNILLPLLAALLVLRYMLGYAETTVPTRLVATLFWLALIVVSFRLLKHVLTPTLAQPGWRNTVPSLLLHLSRVLLMLPLVYYLLSGVWNINVGEWITALGVGSLVIALALQDTLNNLFAGLLLSLNRPFQIGDWIKLGDTEGEVVEVDWRASLLRTRDRDLVVIPNGLMAKSEFKNYSRPTRLHRVREGFDLHISNAPHKVHQALRETALSTPQVLADPAPEVRTVAYEGTTVHYDVFFWIADYGPVARIRNDFMTRAYYHALRHGLKWAVPQREIFQYDGPAVEAEHAVTQERLADLLTSLPSFAMLDDAAIAVLTSAAELLHYGQNEQIVKVGEKERGVYILLDGRVAVSGADENGREHEITQLSVGNFFSESGLFGRAISTVTVTALQDVEILLLPHRAMNDVINTNPRFAHEMNTVMEERKKILRRAQQTELAHAGAQPGNGKITAPKQ